MHVPAAAKRWDERRNTSQVRAAAPDALPNALRALGELRRREPELVAWLEAGAPNLTDAEHRARFGEAYRAGSSSSSRKAPA